MWKRGKDRIEGIEGFFYLALCHNSLMNYYMLNYRLMFTYQQNPAIWDEMVPFEKEIYLQLLQAEIEEKQRNESR